MAYSQLLAHYHIFHIFIANLWCWRSQICKWYPNCQSWRLHMDQWSLTWVLALTNRSMITNLSVLALTDRSMIANLPFLAFTILSMMSDLSILAITYRSVIRNLPPLALSNYSMGAILSVLSLTNRSMITKLPILAITNQSLMLTCPPGAHKPINGRWPVRPSTHKTKSDH